MDNIYKTYYNSPIGVLEIKGVEKGILSIMFVENHGKIDDIPILEECCLQFDEYFRGTLKKFSINFILNGTEFQRKVWNRLLDIPFGKTVTYRDIAESMGNNKAVRAVGNANGKNPLSIVVPCHRVIGSNGNLTGYAGGLWRKEWLINHEREFY